jgi:hypothetical protein
LLNASIFIFGCSAKITEQMIQTAIAETQSTEIVEKSYTETPDNQFKELSDEEIEYLNKIIPLQNEFSQNLLLLNGFVSQANNDKTLVNNNDWQRDLVDTYQYGMFISEQLSTIEKVPQIFERLNYLYLTLSEETKNVSYSLSDWINYSNDFDYKKATILMGKVTDIQSEISGVLSEIENSNPELFIPSATITNFENNPQDESEPEESSTNLYPTSPISLPSPIPTSSNTSDCLHSPEGITYIVYISRIEGTVNTISVNWENDNDGIEQGEYLLPFCRNYLDFSSGDFVYISAQILTPSTNAGSITCKIYQDNYLIAEAEATGFASIATCNSIVN